MTPEELKESKFNRIAAMFSYHPPETNWRKEAHGAVNDAAFVFAKTFVSVCPCLTDDEMMQVVTAIQQARMLANQLLTQKEVLNNIDDRAYQALIGVGENES